MPDAFRHLAQFDGVDHRESMMIVMSRLMVVVMPGIHMQVIPVTLHRWGVVVVVTGVVVLRMTGVAAVARLVAAVAWLVILVARRHVLGCVVVSGSAVDLESKRAATGVATRVLGTPISASVAVLRERSSGTEG